MKSSSIYFSPLMEATKGQYSGAEVVAGHDDDTSDLGRVRAEIPRVLGKGWNVGGWTPEKLLELSRNDKFSAKAKATLEDLATQTLESPSTAPKIAMSDARLTAKELEALMRDFAAERPKIVKNAETIGQARFIQDGWELDKAFMDCVKAQLDAFASASGPALRTRIN